MRWRIFFENLTRESKFQIRNWFDTFLPHRVRRVRLAYCILFSNYLHARFYVHRSNDIDEAIKVVRASLSCAPKGGSAVGDLDPSPMVHENEQDKLTMKCGGMTNIEEKSLANPKMACSLGDSKSVDVIDITDNTHPGYQSLHGTSYADYRAEAQAHAELRTDLLRKAAKAYTEKQGHVASFYAEAVSGFDLLRIALELIASLC